MAAGKLGRSPPVSVVPSTHVTKPTIHSPQLTGSRFFVNLEPEPAPRRRFVLWVTLALSLAVSAYIFSFLEPSQPHTDAFAAYYRPLGLGIFGIWCWGFNIYGLKRLGVEYGTVLRMTGQGQSPPLSASGAWSLAAVASVVFCISGSVYAVLAVRGADLSSLAILPVALLALLLGLATLPFDFLFRDQRMRFWRAIYHVLMSPITEVTFADVLIADLLTSYARVFGDANATMCVAISGADPLNYARKLEECSRSYAVPLVMCLPYLLRLLQCLRQYEITKDHRQLWNAAKYFSSFPAIILSAMKSSADIGETPWVLGPDSIAYAWFFFMLVNTGFSFFWDTVQDWGIFVNSRPGWHLRNRQDFLLQRQWPYILACVVNLVLRTAWLWKLSSALHKSIAGSIALFEIIEVARRCLWIFLRIEYQMFTELR